MTPMTNAEVARMIVEAAALQLAAMPDSVWADALIAGCSPAIVYGVQAAREALHQYVTENDLEELSRQMETEVREGLKTLDRGQE